MAVNEIVGGVILLVVSVAIFALTLMQHTHGQGLSGAINGSAYGANNTRLTRVRARSPVMKAGLFFCLYG